MKYKIRIPEHLMVALELYSLESRFLPEELILLALSNLLAHREEEKNLAAQECHVGLFEWN
jgi:hypothetical protein